MTLPFRVVDEDGREIFGYASHEDALNMCRGWNGAYPTPPYRRFTLDPPTCDNPDCECHSECDCHSDDGDVR